MIIKKDRVPPIVAAQKGSFSRARVCYFWFFLQTAHRSDELFLKKYILEGEKDDSLVFSFNLVNELKSLHRHCRFLDVP
jgi:hypothetical protein